MSDLLGRLLLLTIRENVAMPIDVAKGYWELHNLPAQYMPRQRSATDAFRRATPRKQWKDGLALLDYKGGMHQEEGSRLETVLVYSADNTERVDLHHANRAVLYLAGTELKYAPFSPLTQAEESFIEATERRFSELLTTIDGSQCRNAIFKTIQGTGALTYREGSYLVSREFFSTADAIGGFVQEMQAYTRTAPNEFWDIPYIDTPQTRRQIQRALMEHVERSAGLILTEARGLTPSYLHKKNVGRSRKESLIAQMGDLSRTIRIYKTLLGHELPDHSQRVGQYVTQLAEILKDK